MNEISNNYFFINLNEHILSFDINDIKVIKTSSGEVINSNIIEIIKSDIDIVYIQTNTAQYYLLNNKLHNLNDVAINYYFDYDNFPRSYFINGDRLEYDDWLIHPEKVRHDRKNKLKLLV